MKVIGKILSWMWFISFGSFIVFKLTPNINKSEQTIYYAEKFEAFLHWFLSSPLFLIFFIGMWIFVSFKLAKESGWSDLAVLFSENYTNPIHSKFVTGSGYIGDTPHNGMLKISADGSALYIKVMFLFRFGHKPLQIPWNEISRLKEEQAMISSHSSNFIKRMTTFFTRKKYMKVELKSFPNQYILIQWEEKFNEFIPIGLIER